MIKKLACLVLVFSLLTPSLFAREFLNHADLVKMAASATVEKYPDADDVLIDNYVQVRYQADGTSETWDDTAVKVLTEKGKRNSRSLSLRFNVSYGTNHFEKVEIIKPDGSVVAVDIAAQSKVMVDPSQMSANIYNPNSKILQLSVPGLEIGDTLRYLSHEVRSKTVIPDTWSDYQVFEHTSPIESYTYEVIAPRALPLIKTVLKAEIPGTVTHETKAMEDTIVYTWKVKDVPRMFPEPNMPESYTVAQRLLVSTIDTWEHLSSWYWELCKPRLEATTPEMEAKTKELIADCTTTREKVNAIFTFVSQEIRYVGITTEDEAPGYEPHDAKMTFENRHGVCRDKAALLASMLRLADIEAFPVIIMAGPKKDEEVPQPMFNHAVTAALDDDGSYILMDSTDENTKDIFPSYLQNMSYIVARPEGETLLTSPTISATNNLLRISTNGSLDDQGNLTASSELVFEGVNDTAYRGYFSRIKPDERKRFFEGHIKKGMPTAELKEIEILPAELRDTTQPLTVKLTFTADNLLVRGTEKSMLDLPRLGASLGYANFLIGQTGLEERKYPLYNRITAGITETLNLELPPDSGQINLPDYTTIDTPQLQWNKAINQTSNTLICTSNFELNTVEFSPEEYLTLKQNLKDIEYNNRKKLILDASAKLADSDIRILESVTHINLRNAREWTETTTEKIEILTYSGTKNFSEITENYNPSQKTVELVSATVTQPDGTVKSIEPDAINIMDASWVASAPRYPAEKILVANLPGVEVGSVIEYETVAVYSNMPFYSDVYQFNSTEPIDHVSYSLSAPSNGAVHFNDSDVEMTKTESNGVVTYTWRAENQLAVKPEEQLPAWWAFNPSVFVSTLPRAEYGKAELQHLTVATENQTETDALAKQLVEGVSTDREKVIALRDWVAKNLHAAGPGLSQLPLSAITSADRTLTDRYGNNADRMIVLFTMLKAVGFEPTFILSSGLSLIPEASTPMLEILQRDTLGMVLVQLSLGGETVYLGGESQYAELGTSGFEHRVKFDPVTGALGTIEVVDNKANRTRVEIKLQVDEKGTATVMQTLPKYGVAFEAFHRMFAEITPENRRRYYLETVSRVSQSAKAESDLITDYKQYPGLQQFTVRAERYAVADNDYLYFTLPAGLGGLLKYRSSERESPLAWERYIDSEITYSVILPEGYEPVILPQSFNWVAPKDAGTISINVHAEGNTVNIRQQANLKPALIPVVDYPALIDAGKKLAHPDMSTILLKKVK